MKAIIKFIENLHEEPKSPLNEEPKSPLTLYKHNLPPSNISYEAKTARLETDKYTFEFKTYSGSEHLIQVDITDKILTEAYNEAKKEWEEIYKKEGDCCYRDPDSRDTVFRELKFRNYSFVIPLSTVNDFINALDASKEFVEENDKILHDAYNKEQGR